MEEPLKPPHRHQPISIHDAGAHPIAIAVAVIFIPIALCLVAAAFFLLNLSSNNTASAVAIESNANTVLKKYSVQNATGRQAVCNDGSPGTYYFRPGTGQDANSWIIFLEGGDTCDNDTDCAERFIKEPQRSSSLDYPNTLSPRGILSYAEADNPNFKSFSHVYIKYCSSDAWSGDITRTISGKTAEFRGAKIVGAIFEDLTNPALHPVVNLHDATTILLTGSETGGTGAMQHLDRIATQFPNVPVRGLSDGAWSPNDLGSDTLNYFNSQLDDSCRAAYTNDQAHCLSDSNVYPHLHSPLFVFTNQQRGEVVDSSPGTSGAYFSPNYGMSNILTTAQFTTASAQGGSYANILWNWYSSTSGPVNTDAE